MLFACHSSTTRRAFSYSETKLMTYRATHYNIQASVECDRVAQPLYFVRRVNRTINVEVNHPLRETGFSAFSYSYIYIFPVHF